MAELLTPGNLFLAEFGNVLGIIGKFVSGILLLVRIQLHPSDLWKLLRGL